MSERLTKQACIVIAEVIRDCFEEPFIAVNMRAMDAVEHLARRIADRLARNNPLFNKGQFLSACGLNERAALYWAAKGERDMPEMDVNDRQYQEAENTTPPTDACPNCGHPDHEGKRCTGTSDCDAPEHAGRDNFPCVCSWPDPSNYASE